MVKESPMYMYVHSFVTATLQTYREQILVGHQLCVSREFDHVVQQHKPEPRTPNPKPRTPNPKPRKPRPCGGATWSQNAVL
jgi:hypothetical protein